jgi:hypothetical protein
MGKQPMYTRIVGDKQPSLLIMTIMVYSYIDCGGDGDGGKRERRAYNPQAAHKWFYRLENNTPHNG